MQKIIITGANGFIGKVLTKKLLSLDYDIVSIARLKQKEGYSIENLNKKCKIRAVDILEQDFGSTKEMRGVDTVVHLAARVHVMNDAAPDPLEAFREANFEYTKKMVALAVSAKIKRFVFISSLSLHANWSVSSNYVFSEESKPAPISPYAISKLEAELYLERIAKKTGMEVVIIRPPLVYGPRVKANFLSLLKLTKTGLPLPVGLLNNKRSMIGINNLVDFIDCCINNPKAANETFLISDDHDITTKELFAKLNTLFGKKPLLLPIPVNVLYFLGSLLGKKDIVDRLCSPLQVDITKAKTLLNWRPVQTLDEGLKETVEWYKKEFL